MQKEKLIPVVLKQVWGWIVLSIALGFSGAIFNGIGVALVVPLVLGFLGVGITEFDNLPAFFKPIASFLENFPEQQRILIMLFLVISAILLKNVTSYVNAIVSGFLSRGCTSFLRKEGFRLLLDVDLQYFSHKKLGELIHIISGEIARVTGAVQASVSLATTSITIFVFLSILILLSWQLTLASSIILGLIAFANQFVIRYAKSIGSELSKTSAAYSGRAIEVLSGIRLVKSVSMEKYEYDKIKELITDREKAEFKSQLAFSAVSPINETLSIFAVITLGFIGSKLNTDSTQVYASTLITYLFILTRMLPSVGQLNGARNKFANAVPSIQVVEDFLNRDNKPIMNTGGKDFEKIKHSIEFKDISFKYPSNEKWSLKNVSLSLKKGQTLALVGASGAGKSTLADLLSRFYDPDEGRIEIDGLGLKEISLKQYRKKIGIVSQETFLFNASVRENIRYGSTTASDEDVFIAAKRANALEFIQDLPNGFDTLIGDRGARLSGGQRQRIAIARALVQEPEILILDEATSALDTVSEKLVQEAIEELSRARTTLVIAHRLSTIKNANQIAVFHKGEVVEIGTHEELLARGTYYSNLYNMQFSQESTRGGSNKGDYYLNILSHEIRTQLSNLIGVFRLLDSNLIDTQAEKEEFIGSAYESTLNLFQFLERMETRSN